MGEEPGPTVTVATEPDSVGIEADGVYVTTSGGPEPKGKMVVTMGEAPGPTGTVEDDPDCVGV